jgi:oxygen-dependent protoporphyrinogen oxidase
MLRLAKSKKDSRERPTLQTFREGNETLVRALASKLGPALRIQVKATEITRQDSGFFRVRIERGGQDQSLTAKSLILATPTDVIGKLLAQLDPAFESPLASIQYAAVAVISLGYRKSDIGHGLDGFGFLVPRSAGLRILGTVWNSSLFPGRAPDGQALLTSFVGGATDPEAAKLSAQELASIVHREISPLLSIIGPPVFSNVTIWPRALPQYNLGHGDRLSAITKLLVRFPGIWLTGNYLRGPAIGSCVEQALAVAEQVTRSLQG